MSEIITENFKNIIAKIKSEIKTTQIKAIQQVNSELILMYFRIGKILTKNSRYGNKFIKNIAHELKTEFPELKGFSERNLRNMQLFYSEYRDDKIWQQVVAKLSWGHNMMLISKIKNKDIRKIYAKASLENGWSRNMLAIQIESNYHKRIGNSTNNFSVALPSAGSDMANNIIKDPYIFDFLTLSESYKEKELENKLIEKIRNVLLEFGNGFAYVGNQYKITVGNEDYYIDLLFYHLKLRCYVAVELKVVEYIPEFAGKMNFYLSALDDLVKEESDELSIGLILCKEKNKFVAQYSLKGINNPIGISSYEITKTVPKEILDKLPTEEDLNLHINML